MADNDEDSIARELRETADIRSWVHRKERTKPQDAEKSTSQEPRPPITVMGKNTQVNLTYVNNKDGDTTAAQRIVDSQRIKDLEAEVDNLRRQQREKDLPELQRIRELELEVDNLRRQQRFATEQRIGLEKDAVVVGDDKETPMLLIRGDFLGLKTPVLIIACMVIALCLTWMLRPAPTSQSPIQIVQPEKNYIIPFANFKNQSWFYPHQIESENQTVIHSSIRRVHQAMYPLLDASRQLDCHLVTSNFTNITLDLQAQSKSVLGTANKLDIASTNLQSTISASIQAAQSALVRFDIDRETLSAKAAGNRLMSTFEMVVQPIAEALGEVNKTIGEIGQGLTSIDAQRIRESAEAFNRTQAARPTPSSQPWWNPWGGSSHKLPEKDNNESPTLARLWEKMRVAGLDIYRYRNAALTECSRFGDKVDSQYRDVLEDLVGFEKMGNAEPTTGGGGRSSSAGEKHSDHNAEDRGNVKMDSGDGGGGGNRDVENERIWVEHRLTKIFERASAIAGDGRRFKMEVVPVVAKDDAAVGREL